MAQFKKIIPLLLFIGILSAIFLGYFKPLLLDYLNGESSPFLDSMVNTFYPRFAFEKSRFNKDFLLNKIDQLFYRIVFSFSIIYVFIIFNGMKKLIENAKASPESLKPLFHFIYFGFMLFIMKDWFYDYDKLAEISEFYEPVLLLRWLPFPSTTVLTFLLIILFMSTIWNLAKANLISKAVSLLLFTYFQALFFSFNKINHGYLLFTYVGYFLVFINNNKDLNKHLIQAIKLTIALAYTFAGLEKLFSSGLFWAESTNFQIFLGLHPTVIGTWIQKQSFLCFILPSAAFLFQITFLIAFLIPRLLPYYLISGILFHFSTFLIFNIGLAVHPWLITYIFYLDEAN